MRRGAWLSDPEGLREHSWEGVISLTDLERLGVMRMTAYRRTQHGGPWQLLFPATFLLSNGVPTLRQLEIGALLHAGEGAMLTGLGGARHHGMRRGDDPALVHVLIAIGRQVQSVEPMLVERTRYLPRPLLRDGLPVAPLSRCLIDHVRRMKNDDDISALLTEPVQRRLLPKETLNVELERGTRKGTAAPRRVLRAVGDGVLSAAEFQAHGFWESAPELPPIEWNVTVYDQTGQYVAMVDGLVEEIGLVLEIDSVEQHFMTPEQVLQTARRRRRLEALGFVVVSVRPSQLRDDPAGVLADILHHLAVARAMPAPRATYGRRVS